MDLQACTEKIRNKVGVQSGLNSTMKIDCGSDGLIYVDGLSVPNQVHNDNLDAACTITMTFVDLVALLKRELNPMNAFMLGKIKVAGDMSVVMRLQQVL
jgi:putative sterol carrier protein